MAGRNDIAKYGKRTQFPTDNQPQRNGRKPKLYTVAKKCYNLSYDEFTDVVRYLFQCTKKEIDDIVTADDTPVWMVNVCNAIRKDTSKGVLYTFKELADRLYGTVRNVQAVDVTTNGKDMTAPQIVFSPTSLTEQDIQELRDIQNGRTKESSGNASLPEAGNSV